MAHVITLTVMFFPTTSFKRYLTKNVNVQNKVRTEGKNKDKTWLDKRYGKEIKFNEFL